jgi:16S rRNA (guanine(966)-N(2))-methyltransferase RsmD
MRVIGGEFRSRRLKTVPGLETRPTPDRLRETLFNILAPQIEGKAFLDAYAGTGAVGIEALSRGASRAGFIEASKGAANVIRENLAALGLQSRAEIYSGKVLQHLGSRGVGAYDIVFLDPPYERALEYGEAMRILGAAAPPLVIVQHSTRLRLDEQYGALGRYRTVEQGDNALSFYRVTGSPVAPKINSP